MNCQPSLLQSLIEHAFGVSIAVMILGYVALGWIKLVFRKDTTLPLDELARGGKRREGK